MDTKKVIEKINNDRQKVECCFIFACYNSPDCFEEYSDIKVLGKEPFFDCEDSVFYWQLGLGMHKQGIQKIDAISIEAYLGNKQDIYKRYKEYGGFNTIRDLTAGIQIDNVEGYYKQINTMNILTSFLRKTEDVFKDTVKLSNMQEDDLYNTFDLLSNAVAVNNSREAGVEDLVIDEDFINTCMEHQSMGLPYRWTPLLNYTTLGLPLGDVYMIAAHSGVGKSSFMFENMILYLSFVGEPAVIFSNEMNSNAYKHLLIMHILTHDLNFYELTRKKLKQGEFTEKQLEMLRKAMEISQTKYKNIKFVKVFNNNTSTIMRHIKKFAHSGCRAFFWDTFKSDDISDGSDEWLQLLKKSRRVFSLISKLNVSMVMTFQLALYTTNQRYLDASCLAGSKQVKEVLSELIMMRPLWNDEYTGQKYDCKPYKWNKTGKEKEILSLDPEKKYRVVFVNKTRNDEGGKEILYEWNSIWNKWDEVGYCTIQNDHRGF